MKALIFIAVSQLVLGTKLLAAECPKDLLVKKEGAKTYYNATLDTKYSAKELIKFGCVPQAKVMTRDQQLKLLESEFNAKKAKL